MKVLVCGSRDWTDKLKVETYLNTRLINLDKDICIIEGGAKGADKLGGDWADSKGFAHAIFDANWDFYGNRAGPIRNRWMLDFGQPDLVIAFQKNNSRGTQNMIDYARKKGVPVEVVT